MIYYSPYDTTIGKSFNVAEQIREINRFGTFAKADDPSYSWITEDPNKYVIRLYPNDQVKKFDHPIVIGEKKGHQAVAIDLSSFVRTDENGSHNVANKPLYSLQVLRAYLTSDLCNNGARSIKSMSSGVINSYKDLITNSLSMAFSLNSEEIIALKVLSCWFYYSMLSEEEYLGEMEYQAVVAKLARDTNIQSAFFLRFVDNRLIQSAEDFIEVLKEKISNPALQKLNLGLFFTVVAKNLNSSMWIGLEKQQVLAVSVEHIPTFVALLVMCISEPVFKNAGLAKIALKNFARDKNDFVLSVNSVVNE